MTYQETLSWMFQQLPMYQRQGQTAFKKDLTNIRAFCEVLNQPENQFKSIHVGGTNGKGSVSHMLASVLQSAGYKVGLYTSPHLKDFRERIKINGEDISENEVTKFINQHKPFLDTQKLSFFEMSVGMAFNYFAKENVDVAIIEVGLGGRLDSTNIIQPILSVITNIGLDHTAFLGETLAEIASEKAGIIKANTPVVIGEMNTETKPVFESKAEDMTAEIHFATTDNLDFQSDLIGSYQKINIRTAICAIDVLKNSTLFNISNAEIRHGLANVVKQTKLRGRWEQIGSSPKIIADTGHNQEALVHVLKQLQAEEFTKLHIVLGVVNDKDLSRILPLFPKNAQYYFARPNIPRGLPAEDLQNSALAYNLKGEVYSNVNSALNSARSQASFSDLIFVGGSTFTVAEVLE
ncbi:MAG: folylpolyglutamate synthase/dihydrofolate synthase family protein [Psychroflexus sp.]